METNDFDLSDWLDNYDTYYDEEQECPELTTHQDTQEKAAT